MKEGGGARSGEGRQQWRSLAALSARGITAKWPTQSCFFLFLLPLFPILISSHVSAALYTWKWAASSGGACKGLKVAERWGVTASAASLPSTAPVSSLLPVGIGLIGGVDTSMEMSSLCLMKWVKGMHFFLLQFYLQIFTAPFWFCSSIPRMPALWTLRDFITCYSHPSICTPCVLLIFPRQTWLPVVASHGILLLLDLILFLRIRHQ